MVMNAGELVRVKRARCISPDNPGWNRSLYVAFEAGRPSGLEGRRLERDQKGVAKSLAYFLP
jgi:hypothetical protein